MMELFSQVVTTLLSGVKDVSTLLLLLAVGYMGWDRQQMKRELLESRKMYHDTIDMLNEKMLSVSQDSYAQLVSITDKYHQGQISLADTLHEIKSVLTNMGGRF